MLVVARALLGIFFGAMLMPATLSIIRNIFVDATERRMLLLCGLRASRLARHWARLWWLPAGALDWGSVFLVAVPILIPLLILALIMVPESKDPNPSPVDPLSILLIMVGMTGITFGLTHTSEAGFDAVAMSTISGWPVLYRPVCATSAQP